MGFIANTAFQIRRSNDRYDDLQNRTGLYGSFNGSGEFTPADCSAGFLCNMGAGIPAGGAYMTAAADGSKKLYACNTSDVSRVSANGNTWAVGVNTLGLGIPAGKKDDYTLLKVKETYAFGPGNFSTLMDGSTTKFATVTNGLLVAASVAPQSGYYFELDEEMGIDYFTEGNGNAFARYNLILNKA